MSFFCKHTFFLNFLNSLIHIRFDLFHSVLEGSGEEGNVQTLHNLTPRDVVDRTSTTNELAVLFTVVGSVRIRFLMSIVEINKRWIAALSCALFSSFVMQCCTLIRQALCTF